MSRRPGDLILKDPQSAEPFGLDWSLWLAEIAADETIVTSTWSRSPSSLTLSSPSVVVGGLRTQVVVSGGTLNRTYTVTNSVVTSSGYTDERSFRIWIQER